MADAVPIPPPASTIHLPMRRSGTLDISGTALRSLPAKVSLPE